MMYLASTSNKALKPLPSVAGTPIRGAASQIMPHVSAPLSLKLEGVSLNCVWLNQVISSTTLTVFISIAGAFGSFNVAALNSKVAH